MSADEHTCECQSLEAEAGSGEAWLAAYGLFARDVYEDWKKGVYRNWKSTGALVHHPNCERSWV